MTEMVLGLAEAAGGVQAHHDALLRALVRVAHPLQVQALRVRCARRLVLAHAPELVPSPDVRFFAGNHVLPRDHADRIHDLENGLVDTVSEESQARVFASCTNRRKVSTTSEISSFASSA